MRQKCVDLNPTRRTWVYVQPPSAYEVYCDRCGGEVEWSEYEHLVWCWRCFKDVPGTGGVFAGPVPINCAEIFGMSFDRINLVTGKRLKIREDEDHLVWEEVKG